MKVISVRQFNQEANKRYRNRVDEWKPGKGGFPFRPMYVFQTPEGNDRKRGFVVIAHDDNYNFCLTKKEL